jgi:hypothetical protein
MTDEDLERKRRSHLLAVGGLAPDLPIGSKSIGYFDRNTETWSEPGSARPRGKRGEQHPANDA